MSIPSYPLVRWFTTPLRADGPEDAPVREEVLSDIAQATYQGVHDNVIAVRTPLGAAVLEATTVHGAPIVLVDHVRDDHWARVQFWMNASSLDDIYEHLQALPRLSFEQIFVHGGPRSN
jgi:hypothetical protein